MEGTGFWFQHRFITYATIFCLISRFHQISLDKTLSDNLKGTVIVEHPIFHVVLDPQDRYPLIGTPLRVREPRIKCKKEPSPHGDNDESSGKKQKLTFFDVSDGEEQSDS